MRNKTIVVAVVLLLVATGIAAGLGYFFTKVEDPILARVGTATITASQLARGVPEELFGLARDEARRSRLFRLVALADQRQRLQDTGTQARTEDFEAAFQSFIKDPSQGCECHRYQNFDEYLKSTFQTIDDVRADFWNRQALTNYADQQWKHRYPGDTGSKELLLTEGPTIREKYRHCWALFLSDDGQAQSIDPTSAGNSASAAMSAAQSTVTMAYQRLIQGDPWQVVVDGLIPDSPDKAGMRTPRVLPIEEATFLGFTQEQFENKNNGVIQAPRWNDAKWYVVRWEHLTDEQIVSLHRDRFIANTKTTFLDDIYQHPRVEYSDEGKVIQAEPPGQ